ncbi:hypothetical protein C1646_707419 [Rhizophagus diaphanus]|nr:hypothetical protein C1646_707419 [Rhizophagus diaphanus] [Rhizophagus sp. MUCL 43196]
MNNFCFCINLKKIFLNLICASVSYGTNFAFFFIFRFIICVLGFIGITLNNFLYVTIFINYYLVAVIIDFIRGYGICITIYATLRFLFTLLIVIVDIMQVYSCFAILSYYEKLHEKNIRSGSLVSNNGNGEVSASTYGAVSDQV